MPSLTRCPVKTCRMLHFVGHEHVPGRHRAAGHADQFPRVFAVTGKHRASGPAQ